MNGNGGIFNDGPTDYTDELTTFAERAREVVNDLNTLVADLQAYIAEREGTQ